MTEVILILFAAAIIYYVATRLAPQNLIFRVQKGDDEKPKEVATLSPEIEEDKPEDVLLTEGQELLNKGELDAAEKKFLSAVKIDPAAAKAYHFLGMIYLRQKIYKGAIASLEQACKLDPLNDTAFNNLGLAYFNIDNYDKAIESFEKSVSLNDKIAHRSLNLALAYQKKKEYEQAAIALENAVRIHANPENLTMLAKNYLLMGDKKLARKSVERLVEIDPKNNWGKRELSVLKEA
jgi:tetratricopeptide (TPR) repeat protein